MARDSEMREINKSYEISDSNIGLKDIEQTLWKEKQYVLILKEIYKNKLNQVLETGKFNLKKPLPTLFPTKDTKMPDAEVPELTPEAKKEKEFIQKEILKEKNYMDAFFVELDDILEEAEGTELSFINK